MTDLTENSGAWSTQDAAWLALLAGRAATADAATQREAAALRQAVLTQHERFAAELSAADLRRGHEQLRFRLAREGLLQATQPWWQRPPAWAGLAAALAGVLLLGPLLLERQEQTLLPSERGGAITAPPVSTTPPVNRCLALHVQAQAANERNDLTQLRDLYAAARQTTDCDAPFLTGLGRQVARLYIQQIQARLVQNAADDVMADLKTALEYASLWQALAMLGDAYQDRGDFASATRYYQDALTAMNDRAATPQPPDSAYVQQLTTKLEQTRRQAAAQPR